MTKKSNAVELVSVFGKIKPCGLNSHGSCSDNHTPLRGEQLGTFQLADILYNTVGGVIGGLTYCVMMKARERL